MLSGRIYIVLRMSRGCPESYAIYVLRVLLDDPGLCIYCPGVCTCCPEIVYCTEDVQRMFRVYSHDSYIGMIILIVLMDDTDLIIADM